MKLIHIIAFFVIFLTSCNNRSVNTESENIRTFPVSIRISDCFNSVNGELKLSEIAENIDYIKLETNQESLLGGILTIDPFDNGYLIVDNTESVFLFDKDGKFKWKLNKKGRGPTEYVELSVPIGIDTVFKEIIIPDNRNLVIYDFNGQFKRKLKIPFRTNGVYILPSGNYVLWCVNPFETFIAHIIDRNGNPIKHFANHNLSKRLNEDGVFRNQAISLTDPYGNGIFLSNKDTIWFLDENFKLDTRYLIESKVKNFDDRFYVYGYNVISKSLIGFFIFKTREYFIYNINNNEFYSIKNGIEDDIDFGPSAITGLGDAHNIISICSPSTLISLKSRIPEGSLLFDIIQTLKEDDNPVIRIIKLKE